MSHPLPLNCFLCHTAMQCVCNLTMPTIIMWTFASSLLDLLKIQLWLSSILTKCFCSFLYIQKYQLPTYTKVRITNTFKNSHGLINEKQGCFFKQHKIKTNALVVICNSNLFHRGFPDDSLKGRGISGDERGVKFGIAMKAE